MPALANARWELFAQHVAKGLDQAEAYVAAGYQRNRGNSSSLRSKPEVDARIKELIENAAKKTGITVERVLAEYAKVGFANMQDFVEALAEADLSSLPRKKAAAIAEMIVDTFMDGAGEDARPVRRVKFKLHPKLGALDSIARHLGMFKDQVELTGKNGGPVEIKDVSDKERAKAILLKLAKAKRDRSKP